MSPARISSTFDPDETGARPKPSFVIPGRPFKRTQIESYAANPAGRGDPKERMDEVDTIQRQEAIDSSQPVWDAQAKAIATSPGYCRVPMLAIQTLPVVSLMVKTNLSDAMPGPKSASVSLCRAP